MKNYEIVFLFHKLSMSSGYKYFFESMMKEALVTTM
jgi:hypothetical protein